MSRTPAARQGEVWYADLNPVVGREQAGRRPVLVISVDRFSRGADELVIVVPLTRTDRGTPMHVRVAPPEGGLRAVSFALAPMVRSISRARLQRRTGAVTPETLVAVIERLHVLTRCP